MQMGETCEKLRQQGLMAIHLANVSPLANKMDELLLLNTKNSDFDYFPVQ